MMPEPRPRARISDVVGGRAPLVGARFADEGPPGFVSPVEARVFMGIPYGDLSGEEKGYLDRPDRTFRSDLAVLARVAVARALTPPGGAKPEPRPAIVSARVDNLQIDEALEMLLASPPVDRARMVFFVHPHALNLAAFDPAYRRMLSRADRVLPDGIGIRVAAALLGIAMRHNLNGTDMLPLVCDEAARRGVPLVLVGASEGVADACAEALCESHPGLCIPFVHHGFLDHEASLAVVERIRAVGPALVLVGMGSPRQEQWALEYLAGVRGITVLTVGGLFDFFSGRVPRAPVAWRELGLEWLWRLRQEPRRLARRYVLGNPLFLSLAVAQRTGLRRLRPGARSSPSVGPASRRR